MRRSPDRADDPFEELFLHAYPNPDRVDCPGQEVLRGLATHVLPISHPARLHLTKCSPCFREFLEYQTEWKRKRRSRRVGLAVAACLVLALSSFWVYRYFQPGYNTSLVAKRNLPTSVNLDNIPNVLNYQGISAKRGVDSQPGTPMSEQTISRSRHELSIVLPPGREAGTYVVEIFSKTKPSQPLARYTGKASIDAEGVTTLRTHVDFATFAAGTYTVSWHVAGSEFSQSGTFELR